MEYKHIVRCRTFYKTYITYILSYFGIQNPFEIIYVKY